jgi:aminopeptidase N
LVLAFAPLASADRSQDVDSAGCAAASVDVVDHDVALTLSLDPPSLAGVGTVTVVARHSGDWVGLDARGLTVERVEVGGAQATYATAADRLCVRLPAPVRAGVRVRIQVHWTARTDRETPRFTSDQAWAGYDTPAWMPTAQDPSQRATLTLRLLLPPGLKAAASGDRQEPALGPGGRVTHRFTISRPTPPFLYAFAVGRFGEASLQAAGVKLRALGPQGADLRPVLARTAELVRFMAETTGAPLPAREYQQVFVAGDEAQEAAGLTLLGASALDQLAGDPGDEWIFAHELAHQWFGWLVPCADFSEFWLNEGFATFMVGAEQQRRLGEEAFQREVGRWRERSASVRTHGHEAPISLNPPGRPRRGLPEAELQDRGITYFRGALALESLRQELGERAFWAGVRRYVLAGARTREGATSELLRRSLEAESGEDLAIRFQQWIYATAPNLGLIPRRDGEERKSR